MAENKYKSALRATNLSFLNKLKNVLISSDITDESYEEIMETLVLCDVGMESAEEITDQLQQRVRKENVYRAEELLPLLKEVLVEILTENLAEGATVELPAVVMAVGVNGTGKTTTIAKMANLYVKQGKNVMLAAADTFRAAAVDQLSIWAKRIGITIVKSEMGADAASVAYDAATSAAAKGVDLLIVDTAGRLQNKINLMQELGKMYNVLSKNKQDMNLYTFITVDATSGLNALSQIEAFAKACKLDGIVLSKVDGSSKGGIIIPIIMKYKLPVWFVGIGEGLDDLKEFDAREYVEAMLG